MVHSSQQSTCRFARDHFSPMFNVCSMHTYAPGAAWGGTHHARLGAPASIHSLRQLVSSHVPASHPAVTEAQLCGLDDPRPLREDTPRPDGHDRVWCWEACALGQGSISGKDFPEAAGSMRVLHTCVSVFSHGVFTCDLHFDECRKALQDSLGSPGTKLL